MKIKSKKNKVYFGQDPIKKISPQEKKHEKITQKLKNEIARTDAPNYDDSPFSKEVIYTLLKEAHHPLRLDDILRRLDVSRRSKKEILYLLHDLIDENKIVRQRGASYAVCASLSHVRGRLAIQRSGAGFVTPQKENGEDDISDKMSGKDIYIPQHALNEAWNGDLVEVLILPSAKPNFAHVSSGRDRQNGKNSQAGQNKNGQKQEGRVLNIIERGQLEFTVCIESEAAKPHYKYISEKLAYIGRPTDSRFSFRVLMPSPSAEDFIRWQKEDLQAENNLEFFEEDNLYGDYLPQPSISSSYEHALNENSRFPKGIIPLGGEFERQSLSSQKGEQARNAPFSLRAGDLVIMKVEERLPSSADNPLWRGYITKKLGSADKVSVQEEITKRNNSIPTHFPDDVIDEAKQIAQKEGFYYTEQDEADFKEPRKHKDVMSREAKKRDDIKLSLEEHDVDLRDIDLVTIDGADSKDFDDAVFVEKRGDLWRLLVAIADVSRYVLPYSKIDIEAKTRANSYYFPSSVEPMIPPILSNGLCSLRPHEDHRIMFADMLFDASGKCVKSDFGQGLMRSKARLTYEAVQEFYEDFSEKSHENKQNSTMCASTSTLAPTSIKSKSMGYDTIIQSKELAGMLLHAKDLAHILIEKRRKKGSLHLEIPEPKCVTKNNTIVSLSTRPHFFAHELIEAFMVSANEAVAEFLYAKKAPCLYRIHPAPAPERLETLHATLQTTAVAQFLPSITPQKMGANSWLSHILFALESASEDASEDASEGASEGLSGRSPENSAPKTGGGKVESESVKKSASAKKSGLSKYLNSENNANSVKNSYVAHHLILRSMMQARYSPYLEEHFGLASTCYCHFTSPIRRYADLMVHRSLKECLGITQKNSKNIQASLTKILSEDALNVCADKCNERERVAQTAEREIFRRLACLLLESEVGKEFEAVVSGLSPFGLFAQMGENMAEGMIRMENLGTDYFIYDDEAQCLYGQHTRTIYRLGDAINVVLTSVDLSRLEINLSLAGAKPRGGASRTSRTSRTSRGSRNEEGVRSSRGECRSPNSRTSSHSSKARSVRDSLAEQEKKGAKGSTKDARNETTKTKHHKMKKPKQRDLDKKKKSKKRDHKKVYED